MAVFKKILNYLSKFFPQKRKSRRKKSPRRLKKKSSSRIKTRSKSSPPVQKDSSRKRPSFPSRSFSQDHSRKQSTRRPSLMKPSVLSESKKKLALKQKSSGKTGPGEKGKLVGEMTHFFSKIQVGVMKLTQGGLRNGDHIKILGSTTRLEQTVQSMQVESVDVKAARKGQLIGMKVKDKVREGDKVYKIIRR